MKRVLIIFALSVVMAKAQDPDASAEALAEIQEWAELPFDERPKKMPAARVPLTREDAALVAEVLWEDHEALIRETRAQEVLEKVIRIDGLEMRFELLKFGEEDEDLPLFISMHGGGGTEAEVNDEQWRNQISLGKEYRPASGIYLAPRAPTNNWNLWHEAHIDRFFDRIIQNLVVLMNVDPDKVYFMGYSAGGDGTYQLAPRMADRLAAASMMAGHPNEASPLGLRNIGFTIHVGADDSGYNRNAVAAEWAEKLAALNAEDPEGYEHWVHLHEGCGHWMNLEDREAIPWMEEFTREPLPEKVVWYQDDVTHDRFYWLSVPKGTAAAGQTIVAEHEGQRFDITTENVEELTLLLNDDLVNMDKPVRVTLDGEKLPAIRPVRTAAAIRRSIQERGDPRSIFFGEVTVP